MTAGAGLTIETVLLAALATVLTEPESAETLLVFLERHGRMPLCPDIDVSRTVGWFTAVFPVCVRVAASRRPRETMALVEDRVRKIPNGGIGWGLLGFGRDAPADALGDVARPEVSCNYLGRIDPPLGSGWSIAPESAGREIGRGGTRPTALDVVAHLAAERLHVAWHYDGARHRRTTMAACADRLLEVMRELAQADASRRAS
jgi:non-ribosomal peptide synthase protein (TIGR01720 family)